MCTLPDLIQINFDEMESGIKDSGKSYDQPKAFHTNVFGVARDGALSLLTLVCDIKVVVETRQVVVLLDSGSNYTLIDQSMASKMKAKIVDCQMVRKIIHVNRLVEVKSNPAFFELANPVFAWTVENLAKKNNVVNLSRTKRKFELLRDFNCIPLPTKAKIDVLIGADYHELMQNLEVISSNKSDHLWAVKMLLGGLAWDQTSLGFLQMESTLQCIL
jgi:hypothetical protein